MITKYKATEDNKPFWKRNEQHTRDDWKTQLNIDDDGMDYLITADNFKEVELSEDIALEPINTSGIMSSESGIYDYVMIYRENNKFTADEVTYITDNINTAFPDLNDLLTP
jgi:hypothetical protein